MAQCIEYSTNNSGGSWWLSNQDWLDLEAAGWEVDWVKDDPYYQHYEETTETFLGSTAMRARRYGLSEYDAIAEFETITGERASDEGCHCCGQPHSFYESDAEPRTPQAQTEERVERTPAKVNVVTKSVRSRRATRDNLIEGGHEFEEKAEGSKTTFVVTVPAGYEFSIVVPE